MEYTYKTDSESMEFEAANDQEAIEIAEEETKLTKSQISQGARPRVFTSDGAIVYEVA